MLLQSAINLLSDKILALPFVERYGGLTQTILWKGKRVPVSCSVNEVDCETDQFYQDLIPDSSKKGVLWWTPISGFRDVGQYPSSGVSTYRKYMARARLIGWVNTQQLGIKDCNFAAKAVRSLIGILNSRFNASDLVGTELEGGDVEFLNTQEAVKSGSIFNGYDFGNINNVILYPYDYFAIDVDIVHYYDYRCEYNVTINAPIDCVDNTKE